MKQSKWLALTVGLALLLGVLASCQRYSGKSMPTPAPTSTELPVLTTTLPQLTTLPPTTLQTLTSYSELPTTPPTTTVPPSTAEAPTTLPTTTEAPTTLPPTTETPPAPEPTTTEAPTTLPPTTAAPTTAEPTTTAPPTTAAPPTTEAPTTAEPTTTAAPPTTTPEATPEPTTEATSTEPSTEVTSTEPEPSESTEPVPETVAGLPLHTPFIMGNSTIVFRSIQRIQTSDGQVAAKLTFDWSLTGQSIHSFGSLFSLTAEQGRIELERNPDSPALDGRASSLFMLPGYTLEGVQAAFRIPDAGQPFLLHLAPWFMPGTEPLAFEIQTPELPVNEEQAGWKAVWNEPFDPRPRDLVPGRPLAMVDSLLTWQGSWLVTGESGPVSLVMQLDWLNESGEDKSFNLVFETILFQGGLQLPVNRNPGVSNVDSLDAMVAPGGSQTGAELAVNLRGRGDVLVWQRSLGHDDHHFAVIRPADIGELPEDFVPADPDSETEPTLPTDTSEPSTTAETAEILPSESETIAGEPVETDQTPTSTAPPETDAPPTVTDAPPTETAAPPTETDAPPTETDAPPTETTAPSTETEPDESGDMDPTTTESTEPEPSESEPDGNGMVLDEEVVSGESLLTFRSASLVPASEGRTALKLLLDWRNGNPDIRTADETFAFEGVQNWQLLDNAPSSDYIDHEPAKSALLPGTVLRGLQYGFVLDDLTAPVTVTVRNLVQGGELVFEIDPATLAERLQPDDFSAEMVEDFFIDQPPVPLGESVEIGGETLTAGRVFMLQLPDYDAVLGTDRLLVASFAWTNRGAVAETFGATFRIRALQNGLGCRYLPVTEQVPEPRSDLAVGPGESIREVLLPFVLRDDSPVRLTLERLADGQTEYFDVSPWELELLSDLEPAPLLLAGLPLNETAGLGTAALVFRQIELVPDGSDALTVLRLVLDFGHGDVRPRASAEVLDLVAVQNGIELEAAAAAAVFDPGGQSRSVLPGSTLRDIEYGFVLPDTVSPVELTVKLRDAGAEAGTLVYTLLPDQAPMSRVRYETSGLAGGGWTPGPLDLAYGLPLELTQDTFVWQATDYCVDGEGVKTLRLTYDWTNRGAEETGAALALSLRAYQNGVELTGVNAHPLVDPDGLRMKSAAPGETVGGIVAGWTLEDDGAVLIAVADIWESEPAHYQWIAVADLEDVTPAP